MDAPLPPGTTPQRRAPLPTVALVVGGTFCALALAIAFLRSMAEQLAHDALVVRALGITLGMASVMLIRVALAASTGLRRIAALVVAAPMLGLGGLLLVWPAGAALLYDRGMGSLAPWFIAVPGILALALSRWQIR